MKSHHCVQKDMVDVQDVVKLANRLHVPCIIDAAAEEDLSRYMAMGADMVCYSGAKAIEGPTSGFVACKTTELASLIQDEAGREIYRAKITFHKETYGYSAKEMLSRLQEGEYAVYTRDYQANIGSLAIDPRPLNSLDELEYIYKRISEIGKEHA